MQMVIDTAAKQGVDTFIMGMPHRLVTIINILFTFYSIFLLIKWSSKCSR